MDQNGADGAAEDGAAVYAAEHDEARGGIHAEGDRKKKRHAHGSGKAGQTSDRDAQGRRDEHGDQIDRAQRMNEACAHQRYGFEHPSPPSAEKHAGRKRHLEKQREDRIDQGDERHHRECDPTQVHLEEEERPDEIDGAGDVIADRVHQNQKECAAARHEEELQRLKSIENLGEVVGDREPAHLPGLHQTLYEIESVEPRERDDEAHRIRLRLFRKLDGHDEEGKRDGVDDADDAQV